MSTNDRKKIVEDSPTMRSVALVSPPLMPLMQPLTPLKVSSSVETKSYTTPVNNKSAAIVRFPAFPDDYFLERTHVRIHDATAEEVMSRVSAILDHESIATTYDHKEVSVLDRRRYRLAELYVDERTDLLTIFFFQRSRLHANPSITLSS